MDSPEDKNNRTRQIGVYVTIPFVLAVPPVVGYFLGYFLDRLIKTAPVCSYVLLALGFFAGFREVFRLVKKFGNGT